MNGDKEFAHALSDYLALHTNASSGYLFRLIQSFLRGAPILPRLDPTAKSKIIGRLKAEVAAHNEVPNFFQNYLLTHLQQDTWPPQVAFFATRYLHRSNERYVSWRRRQQQFAELEGEAVGGTELGFSQMLYSQGVDSAFRWRGVPCFKTVHDLAIYPMLIDELRPGTIIELGAGSGGSGLFFADVCAAAGLTTKIISIDQQIGEVSDPRIEFVQDDCAQWLAEAAASQRLLPRPCLMVEDFHGELPGFFAHIDAILQQLIAVLDGIPALRYEIIIVDDDSPDRTWQKALQLSHKFSQVRAIRRQGHRDLSTAVLCGWQIARGEILAVMDADLQHPPEAITELWRAIRRGADLAIASRNIEGGGVSDWTLPRRIVSRCAQLLGLVVLPEVTGKVSDHSPE